MPSGSTAVQRLFWKCFSSAYMYVAHVINLLCIAH